MTAGESLKRTSDASSRCLAPSSEQTRLGSLWRSGAAPAACALHGGRVEERDASVQCWEHHGGRNHQGCTAGRLAGRSVSCGCRRCACSARPPSSVPPRLALRCVRLASPSCPSEPPAGCSCGGRSAGPPRMWCTCGGGGEGQGVERGRACLACCTTLGANTIPKYGTVATTTAVRAGTAECKLWLVAAWLNHPPARRCHSRCAHNGLDQGMLSMA